MPRPDVSDCRPEGMIVTAQPLGVLGPGRLIDGLLDTEWQSDACTGGWCVGTNDQVIVLDLAVPTCVTSVTVRWAGQNSATAYTIESGLDGSTYAMVREITGYSTTINNRMDRITANFNRTRFVKFTLTTPGSNTHFAMKEIQWEADESVCSAGTQTCGSIFNCDACIAVGCGWCKDADRMTACGLDRPDRCDINGSAAHVSFGPLPRMVHDRNFCDDDTASLGPAAGGAIPSYTDTTSPTLTTAATSKAITSYACGQFTIALDSSAAASSTALNFNYVASRAFDGVRASTEYANVWIAEEGVPQWISYDFENRTGICGYAFSAKPVAPWLSPSSWVLQGTNNGDIWWDIQAVEGEVGWTPQQRRVYTLDDPVAYSQYRFYVTAAETGDVVSLQEIEIMAPLDECITEEFETGPPTASTDRVCTGTRQCRAYEYETVPPVELTDRVCEMLTVCNAVEEFETTPPTPTTDRNCTELSICGQGNYERLPPTSTTDRECTGIIGPTASIKEIFSDAIELRWTEPSLDRGGFRYLGFTVYVNGNDSVALDPLNNFTESNMLYQTVRGLEPTTVYTFVVTAIWEVFGESMYSNEVVDWTGPSIAPAGFATALFSNAMNIEFTRPVSQYNIGGWRIYARVAPYLLLEDYSCGGEIVDTFPGAASGVCEDACQELGSSPSDSYHCAGFRWMATDSTCQLVKNISEVCVPGCDGNFYKKKVPMLVGTQIRDTLDLHPSNDHSDRVIEYGITVSGLAAGTTYDFYVAAKIYHPIRGWMYSLAADGEDGYEKFSPTFQQVTTPAVLASSGIRVTGLWADALQIDFDEPWVPDDVVLDGYQVYFGDPDTINNETDCVDDPTGLLDIESSGMNCEIMSQAFGCSYEMVTTTVAQQCCTSCAGFQEFPDKPESNSLDLAQACGQCGIMLPRTPTSMYVRGLSWGERLAFKMIPIISDRDLRHVWALPDTGLLSAAVSFEQLTAPGPVTGVHALTTGFDSVLLSWEERTDLGVGTTVVGYKVFYRISCTVSIPYSCQTQNPITLRPQDDLCTATYCGDFTDTAELTTSILEIRNNFVASGPVLAANITGLPARQIDYDFLVFPILLTGASVGTESMPYDGANKARPFVTQRTVDVPAMPTGITAQASDGGALVFFTAPADTGGVVITVYTVYVEAVTGGDYFIAHSLAVSESSSPIMVNLLHNGVAYALRVSASNSFGEGAISDASDTAMPYSDCAVYEPPPFANATCEGGNYYRAVCDNHCDPGFAPRGSSFFKCLSTGAWEGDFNCTDIDECLSGPCANGAGCNQSSDAVLDIYRAGPMVLYDAYICYCTNGYEGFNCENYTTSCLSSPCMNGGTCATGEMWEYSCACDANFRGDNCDICDRGWEGDDCSIEVDECVSSPCFNGGSCFDAFNAYRCHCPPGYNASRCEVDIDDCASMPCNGNGVCHDRVDSFECACLPGFISEQCENHVLICDPDDNLCNASAACWYNGPWIDPQCACDIGFSGDGYTCDDIDECASSPCFRGNCTQSNASEAEYWCTCDVGWTGVLCDVELYECESSPCLHNAVCDDAVGGYTCECQPGYSGNTCEGNIDECASNPCSNGANCTDLVLGWSCDCTGLREYTGEVCDTEIDYCALETDDCDRQHSVCVYVSAGNYTCDCDIGYRSTAGGRVCVDIDECEGGLGVCNVNGTAACADSNSDIAILPNRYECICKDGVTGALCDIDLDECVAQPCQNGGTCVPMEGFYECTCLPGWYSYNCEIEVDECRSNPCKHGSCADAFLAYVCTCDAGWDGDSCHIDVDECSSTPCDNGATCDDLIDQYLCTCAAGFVGANCTSTINECLDAPCHNAGLCYDLTADFTCSCPFGFDGSDCSNVVDQCARQTDVCDRLHSRCIHTGPGTYSCDCSPGWNGAVCDTDIEVPVLECITNFTVVNEDGVPYSTILYDELLPLMASDNSAKPVGFRLLVAQVEYDAGGTPIYWQVVKPQFLPGEEHQFKTGTSEVVITASDAAGNEATCYTRVYVLSPIVEVTPMFETLVNDVLVLRPSGDTVVRTSAAVTDSAEGYVTIENTGTADLWVDDLIMDVYWAFLFKDSVYNVVETPFRIEPGRSTSVGIFFEGPIAGLGTHTGNLRIQTNDPERISAAVPVQTSVSRLQVTVPVQFDVTSATVVVLTQPQTIPQLVLSPNQLVVVPINIYNVRNTTVHWTYVGCEGNYYWFDRPRTLPTPWGVGSGGGVDVLPICDAVLEPGERSESQLYVEAPKITGLYQASIPIFAMEGNGTANITEMLASNDTSVVSSTWLVGVSIRVLPDVLDASLSSFQIISTSVNAGQQFDYELTTVDKYGNEIDNSRQQFRAIAATVSAASLATSGTYLGESFTGSNFSIAPEHIIISVDGAEQNITLATNITEIAEAIAVLFYGGLHGVVAVNVGGVIKLTSSTAGTSSSITVMPTSGSNAKALFGNGASVTGVDMDEAGADFSHGGSATTFESYYDFDVQRHKIRVTLANATAYQLRVDSYWTGGMTETIVQSGQAVEEMLTDCGGGTNRMRLHNMELDFATYVVPPSSNVLWNVFPMHSVVVYNMHTTATYTGASFAPYDFSGNDILVVLVDGVEQTVDLTTNIQTAADAVTALAGLTGAVVSEASGNILITSSSAGRDSSVTIGDASGTNAAALFGSGMAVAGQARGGMYTSTSFTAWDFSGNENLVVIVDGVDQTFVLSTVMTSAADVVTALAGLTGAVASEVAGARGTYTGASLAPYDFDANNENLVLTVDGVRQTVPLTSDITSLSGALTALGAVWGAVVTEASGNLVITSSSSGASSVVDIATSGTYTGALFTARDFTSVNENLIVTVDGADQTVLLTSDITSTADAVTALAGLTGVAVSEVGGNIVITSSSTGGSSAVTIGGASDANAAALFGSGVAMPASGTNAAALFGSGVAVAGFTTSATYHGFYFTQNDFSGAEDLVVTVDGVNQILTLTADIETPADLVIALASLTGVDVAEDGGDVVLTTSSAGASSAVTIGGASDANAAALFGSGVAVPGTTADYPVRSLAIGALYPAEGSQWSFSDLPDFMAGNRFIQTRHSDTNSSSSILDFTCFTIDYDSTVYVLYDTRAEVAPTWLSDGFQKMEGTIARSLVDADLYADSWYIYFAERNAHENICLGGNYAPGVEKMYIPAVGPRVPQECTRETDSYQVSQLVGIRIANISAPYLAHIHDVHLSFLFNVNATVSGTVLAIQMQDSTAMPLTESDGNLSSRTTHNQTLLWSLDDNLAAVENTSCRAVARSSDCWQEYSTPDLTPLLSEVVGSLIWNAGDDILFVISSANISSTQFGAVARVNSVDSPIFTYSFGEKIASNDPLVVSSVPCAGESTADTAGSACVCNDGYYLDDDLKSCIRCPAAFYGRQAQCHRCTDGTLQNADATGCDACPAKHAGKHGLCSLCDDGKQPSTNQSICEHCPVGQAGIQGECSSCGPGTEPDVAKHTCPDCAVGHVSPNGTSCDVCGPGKQPDAGQSTCEGCPATFAGATGTCQQCDDGERPNSHSVACEPCPSGTAGRNGQCILCPEGKHSTEDLMGCQSCLSGFEPFDGICVGCRSGYVGFDGVCAQCADGYLPDADLVSCLPCPPGWAGRQGGCFPCGPSQYPNENRTACSTCTTGRYSIEGISCEFCPVGQQPNLARTDCEACGYGKFSDDGKRCIICDPGYEPGATKVRCEQCVGQYSADGRECFSCRRGEEPTAIFAASGCRNCATLGENMYGPDGISCAECGPGSQALLVTDPGSDNSACVGCSTLNTSSYSPDGYPCLFCVPGTQPNTARTACESCVLYGDNMTSADGAACQSCPAGTEPNAERTTCIACPAGTQSPDGVVCLPCSPGEEPNSAQDGCSGCPLGEVSTDGTSCYSCATRYEQPNYDDGQTDCFPCPCNEYYIPSVYACHVCLPGFTLNNDTTLVDACIACGVGESGIDGSCTVCPDGYYANEYHTQCLLCGAGRIGVAGVCQDCPNGTMPDMLVDITSPPLSGIVLMQAQILNTTCETCPIARYSRAGSSCDICSPGTQPNTLDCDVGPSPRGLGPTVGPSSTVRGSRASFCVDCDWGKQSPSGENCTVCPVGQQPNAEQTGCEDCGYGMYSPTGENCTICDPGYEPDLIPAPNRSSGCRQCVDQYSAHGRECFSCQLGEEPSRGEPYAPFAATGCRSCASLGNDMYGPDGINCASCGPATRPIHFVAAIPDDYNIVRLATDLDSEGRWPILPRSIDWPPTFNGSPPPPPGWVVAGPCTLSPGTPWCVRSPGYAERRYHPVQSCTLQYSVDAYIHATEFTTESGYDYLRFVSSAAAVLQEFSGTVGPTGEVLDGTASSTITWESDTWDEVPTSLGWEVCATPVIPPPPPTPSNNWAMVIADNAFCMMCSVQDDNTVSLNGTGPCHICLSGTQPNAKETACESCVLYGDNMTSADGAACQSCPAGTEPDAERTTCIACPAGTQSPDGVVCLPCSPGEEPNSAQDGCVSCSSIAPNLYSDDGRSCRPCHHGTEPNFVQRACIPCGPRGRAGVFGVCDHCEAGTEPNILLVLCLNCGPGKYNTDGIACVECVGEGLRAVDGVQCTQCPNGTKPNEDGGADRCEVCEDGWAGQLGICRPCPPGRQPSADHTECESCPAGAVSTSGIACSLCAAGRAPNPRDTSCDLCPSGRWSPGGVARCPDCWPLSESIPTRDWCACSPGAYTFVNTSDNNVTSCEDVNECVIGNGGCDMRTHCNNTSPGRVCGACPPGYLGPYLGQSYTVLAGNTTCFEPYVTPVETTLAPELTLLLSASPLALVAGSAEQEELKAAFIADTARRLGVNESQVQITSIASPFRRRQLQHVDDLDTIGEHGDVKPRLRIRSSLAHQLAKEAVDDSARRLLGESAVIELSFLLLTDEPAIIDELNAQLANPGSLDLGNFSASYLPNQNIDKLNLDYSCPGRRVRNELFDTCVPCPGKYEYFYDGEVQQCVRCPVGMWSSEGGYCTSCPLHEYTGDQLRCERCWPGYTVNGTSSGCDACNSSAGWYNDDGCDCLHCPNGTRPDLPDLAATHCVACSTDGPNRYSPIGVVCEHVCPPGTQVDPGLDACTTCASLPPRVGGPDGPQTLVTISENDLFQSSTKNGYISSDGTVCVHCLIGTRPEPGRANCSACTPGWYGDDGVRCQRCPIGHEPTALVAALGCRPCIAAHWSNGLMAECQVCPDPMMIVDGPDAAADAENDCRCPDGTFDSTVYTELRCWTDGQGQPGLLVAAAGGPEASVGVGRCIPCPVGCTSCSGGIPRLLPGFHLANEVVLLTAAQKSPLPPGNVHVAAAHQRTILELAQVARITDSATESNTTAEVPVGWDIYRCPLPEACTGDLPAPLPAWRQHDMGGSSSGSSSWDGRGSSSWDAADSLPQPITGCADGFHGRLCMSGCIDGYVNRQQCTALDPACETTRRSSLIQAYLIAAGLLFGLGFLHRVTIGRDKCTRNWMLVPVRLAGRAAQPTWQVIMLLAGSYQVLGNMPRVLGREFPAVYTTFVRPLLPLANLDLTALPTFSCTVTDFAGRLWFRLALFGFLLGPALVISSARLSYLAAHPFGEARTVVVKAARKVQTAATRRSTTAWLWGVTVLVHPSLMLTAVQMFFCRTLDSGEQFLRADLELRCKASADAGPDTAYATNLSAAVAILAGGLGFLPVMLTIALLRKRKKLRAGQVVPTLAAVVSGFRPSRYMWPVWLLLERAVIGGVAMAASAVDDNGGFVGGGTIRPAGCAVITAGFAVAIGVQRPFLREADNAIALVAHLAMLGTFALSLGLPLAGSMVEAQLPAEGLRLPLPAHFGQAEIGLAMIWLQVPMLATAGLVVLGRWCRVCARQSKVVATARAVVKLPEIDRRAEDESSSRPSTGQTEERPASANAWPEPDEEEKINRGRKWIEDAFDTIGRVDTSQKYISPDVA